MPQLDLLTFSLQVGIIFWLSWSLYLVLSTLILSQYLSYNLFKKLDWISIVDFLINMKYHSVSSYLHLLNINTRYIKFFFNFLNFYKIFTSKLMKTLRKFLRLNLRKYLNSFFVMFSFLNLISFEHNFGQKYNLNFLLIRNLNYIFVQNYVQKKLNLKKKTLQKKNLNIYVNLILKIFLKFS